MNFVGTSLQNYQKLSDALDRASRGSGHSRYSHRADLRKRAHELKKEVLISYEKKGKVR